MFRCILWGTGKVFYENISIIRYHEIVNNICVVGLTADKVIFDEIAGWKFIRKEELYTISFDLIIIMSDRFLQEIEDEAVGMGVDESAIISYRALKIPPIDLKKYMVIRNNPPSIFSNNCWGGVTYHSLGMKFTSPLINLFMSDADYFKLLNNPKYYMDEKLYFEKEGYDENQNMNYPICTCGDIHLYFNHYKNFDAANYFWEKRKARINWSNLFIMMYTQNYDLAMQFVELPYKKKICFVPFPTDKEALHFVDFYEKEKMKGMPFNKVII